MIGELAAKLVRVARVATFRLRVACSCCSFDRLLVTRVDRVATLVRVAYSWLARS